MNPEGPRADADVKPSLDSLDDEALRAIAYGRATDARERMRAHTASRILANRHAAVMPGPIGARAAGPSDGSSPAVRNGEAHTVNDGGQEEQEEVERAQSRRRALLIGTVIAALVAGSVIGFTAEQIGVALQPDSLSVFDRPATDQETAALASSLNVTSGEARLLAELDDVRVYGVRTDAGVFFGTGELGTEICVIADTDDDTVQYVLFNCVPEQVFRDHGMSGVLSAFELFGSGFTPAIARTLAFQWGPRGGLDLEDISADILTTTTDRFSEQDLLQGLDIPLVQVIREQEPDPAIARDLPGALFGPIDLGGVSNEPGVSARLFGSIFPASDGGDGFDVCLSAEVVAEGVVHECVPMGVFRTSGAGVTVDSDNGPVTFTISPNGDVMADSGT